MATVIKQIESANYVICSNIESFDDQRALLSQNLLSQLRNLVEGVAVLFLTRSTDAVFDYTAIQNGIKFIRTRAKLRFLDKFHKQLQKSASHYTFDGDGSERLMLKYYEYLYRMRSLVQDEFEFEILTNLESFPVDLDPSLYEYHQKIAEKINLVRNTNEGKYSKDRYYIHRIRPFFLEGRVYYEVTFNRAINKVSKFDRIIAFTDIDMTDKYAATLTLQPAYIEVFGKNMPITVIRKWEVSIRPCEFDNFARLLGSKIKTRTNSKEYRFLMKGLTAGSGSLLDLVELSEEKYESVKNAGTSGVTKPILFPLLDAVRQIVSSSAPGHNILRYLLLRMNNKIIKLQYSTEICKLLSGMKLEYGCIPFDTMPFCTSLLGHNPRYWDLIESLDTDNRSHELLARRVKNNVERHGVLYTPLTDLQEFEETEKLISTYNNKLYRTHQERRLVVDMGHVFIAGYENDTVSIVETLQDKASSGIAGYTNAVEHWIKGTTNNIDDPIKKDALKQLFSNSCVALIYGAAGTGKSTMVDHIAQYFNDKDKLFLAHTNPAIDNLKRRVSAQNSEFRTISSQIYKGSNSTRYDLLIIDECSTVSNEDLIRVLTKTSFRLLVLVGDVYQIESIQFGNWFGIIRSFIPSTSIFELTTPYRTTNKSLLGFWNKVRGIEDDIAESMAHNNYSSVLNESLFETRDEDEIILCLNYDGLYGINNVNRFLQSSNPSETITWRVATYKVGDPILFYETERFRPVIYNNLKGTIVGIDYQKGQIQFDVDLDRPLTEFDVFGVDLEWLGDSTVRFSVFDLDTSDEDDDSNNTTIPFQVAYAVSIHKAQGLEYDSVKIVITDSNEDDITHSIFYTAVTRARKQLQVFWTPETQQRVLEQLTRITNTKDVSILSNRRDLKPLNK